MAGRTVKIEIIPFSDIVFFNVRPQNSLFSRLSGPLSPMISAAARRLKPSAFGPKDLLLNRYVVFGAALYAYALLVEWTGGLSAHMFPEQWLEIVLVFYLYFFFNQVQRPSRYQAVLAALPIFLALLAYDIYYLMYGKVFRLPEFAEVPELLQVLPASYLALVSACVIVPLGLFAVALDLRRPFKIAVAALPLAVLVLMMEWFPSGFSYAIDTLGNEIVFYSDAKSVENNGRFVMLLYREAQRLLAVEMTEPYRNRGEYDHAAALFARKIRQRSNQRDVHVVVLESFLDPTLFHKARFTRSPMHPDFTRLFGNHLGLSISPVFGGATAQAEFEVLCGVPAFESIAGIEFNAFTGANAHCLPDILAQAGYRTMASNAFRPNFFNTIPAYQGIGFREVYFPREYAPGDDTYLAIGDVAGEDYMFDGTLFDENLAFVEKVLKEKGRRPLFNYVLTVYGHTPHDINTAKRPQVLKVISDYPDDHLQREANQFYYRTEAIAHYVRRLIALDPHSLIILVSDHVPPLRNGLNTYRELAYMGNIKDSYHYNRILIIENGRPVRYRTMHHYEVGRLVYNYITNGRFCRSAECEFLDGGRKTSRPAYFTRYLSLMAHASE